MKFFNKYFALINICLLFAINLSAQDYSVAQIPDSLTKDAVAVIRDYTTSFVQTNKMNGIYEVSEVVTILNKHGDSYANFYTYGDKFRELRSFSGIIRDASGSIVKKIKKGDLTISSISDGSTMASDQYSISYDARSLSYPFTVEYTYQIKMKGGIITYPSFAPSGYGVAIEKAKSTVELPSDMTLRYKSNYDCNLKFKLIENKKVYTLSIKGMKAKPYEVLAPSFRNLLPRVLMAPSDFCYDSQCGDMSNWKGYGLWVSSLLKDRDILPADFVSKLTALTQNAKDEREKVQILYQYLQDNSRYVSIQMGIGGLQPTEAATVAKTGFGDCKGLSNLMKAMLKAVDISSNYCEISMSERDLYNDFANVSQTDHAILLVPLKNDSIWLECTSQTLPFGYIHSRIAGHDALVISEDGSGGQLCKLPSYSDTQNNKTTVLNLFLKDDGSADGNIKFIEYLHGYASAVRVFTSNDREKKVNYINAFLKLPQIHLGEISTSENRSELPSCSLEANFHSTDFANKTGNRLFLPLCPLNKGVLSMFSTDKRIWDIDIEKGFSESDTIIFTLPESYALESLPKDIDLNTLVGSFKTVTKIEGNQVFYTQYLDIYSGRYNKESYKEIKDFFSQLSTATKRKLVIKKE